MHIYDQRCMLVHVVEVCLVPYVTKGKSIIIATPTDTRAQGNNRDCGRRQFNRLISHMFSNVRIKARRAFVRADILDYVNCGCCAKWMAQTINAVDYAKLLLW